MILHILDLQHFPLRLAGLAIDYGVGACDNLVLTDANANDLGAGKES
ncbi:MAG: hypothetical protein ACM3NN_08325 [Nitrospirota bacterium]